MIFLLQILQKFSFTNFFVSVFQGKTILVSKETSLGTIGNTIAGAIGGTAGAWILHAVGILSSMGLADMSVGSLVGGAATSVVSGGVVTAIIGMIKSKMA